jgi:DNA-binding MarR family transcriptional regulator
LPEICKSLHSAVMNDPQMAVLTVPQVKAVSYLYHNGEQTVSGLANGLATSLPSASELIDRLVDRGLVERFADPQDRRRVLVGLTPEALNFARRLHDLRRIQVRDALRRMPEEDWPHFLQSLRALAAALSTQSLQTETARA